MQQLLKTAIRAALEAGKAILEVYHSEEFDVEMKGDNSPLTKADKASHNVIMSFLSNTNIPVLSEEGKSIPYEKRKDWKLLWIVDPVDGTKEFIKRNGEFTVNIALIENQKPLIGVIFVPANGGLYFSSKERGSFRVKVDLENYDINNLVADADKLPLQREDKAFTIVASRSHMSQETESYIQEMRDLHGKVKIISKGSSLKLCMVAEGSANSYPRLAPTMEWDTAAAHAIAKYAGCEVNTTCDNGPFLYNKENLLNPFFIVKRKNN